MDRHQGEKVVIKTFATFCHDVILGMMWDIYSCRKDFFKSALKSIGTNLTLRCFSSLT